MIKPTFAPTTSLPRPNLSFEPTVRAAIRYAKVAGRVLRALLPGPFLLFIAFETIVQSSLGVRLFYAFDGGQPRGAVVEELYDLSAKLVAPFTTWDGDVTVDTSGIFHLSTIVAMDVYLFAGIIAIVSYTILRGGFGVTRAIVRLQNHRAARRRSQRPIDSAAADEPVAAVAPEGALSDQVA